MDRWQALEGGPLMIVIGEVLLVVCSLSYCAAALARQTLSH